MRRPGKKRKYSYNHFYALRLMAATLTSCLFANEASTWRWAPPVKLKGHASVWVETKPSRPNPLRKPLLLGATQGRPPPLVHGVLEQLTLAQAPP